MSLDTTETPPALRVGSLASGPISCPGSGAETVLKRFNTWQGLHAYIKSRAYFVAGAPTDVKFRLYIGGAPVGDDVLYDRNTQLGGIGAPKAERTYTGPGGREIKITFINNDATTYSVECDGDVEAYRAKLPT